MGHSTDKRQQAIKARFIMVSLQTKRYYLYTKNAVIRGPVIRGRPRLWARSMTARFLFRFGMLRTFKHKTRGHRPRPQSSGALCALWLAKYVIALAKEGNQASYTRQILL